MACDREKVIVGNYAVCAVITNDWVWLQQFEIGKASVEDVEVVERC